MAFARLIICEATSKWVVAFRRQLPSEIRDRIRETRHPAEALEEARAYPNSFLILEITRGNLEQLASLVRQLQLEIPKARVAVVGEDQLRGAEWFFRELGAIQTAFSSRSLSPLVRMIRSHCARASQTDPTHDGASPWTKLPWGLPRETGRDNERLAIPTWLRDA